MASNWKQNIYELMKSQVKLFTDYVLVSRVYKEWLLNMDVLRPAAHFCGSQIKIKNESKGYNKEHDKRGKQVNGEVAV